MFLALKELKYEEAEAQERTLVIIETAGKALAQLVTGAMFSKGPVCLALRPD